MRGRHADQDADLQHLKIVDGEPVYDNNPEGKYRKERTYNDSKRRGIRMHPGLDRAVKFFDEKRQKRKDRIIACNGRSMTPFA
jgi:hypothetical protein